MNELALATGMIPAPVALVAGPVLPLQKAPPVPKTALPLAEIHRARSVFVLFGLRTVGGRLNLGKRLPKLCLQKVLVLALFVSLKALTILRLRR